MHLNCPSIQRAAGQDGLCHHSHLTVDRQGDDSGRKCSFLPASLSLLRSTHPSSHLCASYRTARRVGRALACTCQARTPFSLCWIRAESTAGSWTSCPASNLPSGEPSAPCQPAPPRRPLRCSSEWKAPPWPAPPWFSRFKAAARLTHLTLPGRPQAVQMQTGRATRRESWWTALRGPSGAGLVNCPRSVLRNACLEGIGTSADCPDPHLQPSPRPSMPALTSA